MNFHRNANSDKRSTRVTHHAKASSAGSTEGTGDSRGLLRRALATRGASSDVKGTGAPAARRAPIALIAVLATIAGLALTAAPASAATAEMGSISEISYTTAHVSGKVITSGGFFGQGGKYTFEYSTDETDWKIGPESFYQGTNKEVGGELQGLKGGTKYFVRLSVLSPGDLPEPAFSPKPYPSFTTLTADPTSVVTIDNASEVAYTTAKATGKIKRPEKSDNVACHFEYITDAQFTANEGNSDPGFTGATPIGCEPKESVEATGDVPVSAKLSALNPATTYHLRLAVSNAANADAKEAASTFTTLTVAPPSVISTDNATAVEYSQAQVKGVVKRPNTSIDPAFDINSCNFEYISDAQFKENEEDLSQPGFTGAAPVACDADEFPIHAEGETPVKAKLTGLAASTTYHLRLAVSNLGGSDAKEAAATFTTAGPVPKPTVISTDDPIEVKFNSAKVSGEVQRPAGEDPALNVECRFEVVTQTEWEANSNAFPVGAPSAPCAENPITKDSANGEGKQKVSAELIGLAPETSYHFRLAAENIGGVDTKDALNTFTTPEADKPVVTIDPVAGGTFTTAHVSGTIEMDDPGYEPGNASARIEISTDNVSWSVVREFNGFDGDLVQNVEVDIKDLQPSTTYFFRIAAKYGSIEAFDEAIARGEVAFSPEPNPSITTGALFPPTAEDLAVTDITGTSAHFSATVNPHAPAGSLSEAGKKAFATTWTIKCLPECKDKNGNPLTGVVQGEEGAQLIGADAKRLEPDTPYEATLTVSSEGGTDTESITFDTLKIPPTVKQTPGASDGKGGYTLQGVVNPNNQTITACEFKWGPNSAAYAFSAPCSPLPNGIDERQKVRVESIAGQFRLSFEGQTTGDIPFDADASLVQAELELLSSIGASGISGVTRTVEPANIGIGSAYAYDITFAGPLADRNLPPLEVENGTEPIGGGLSVLTITQGGTNTPITVEAHLTDLNPNVDYHALLVVTYGAGSEANGVDQTFKATLALKESCLNEGLRKENSSLALPECRAYEKVSPSGKEGFAATLGDYFGGARVFYETGGGNIAKSGQALTSGNKYVATRSASNWETIPDLNGSSGSLRDAPSYVTGFATYPMFFSKDLLSSTWRMSRSVGPPGKNYSLRNPDGSFTLIGLDPEVRSGIPNELASADLSHLLVWRAESSNNLRWGAGLYDYEGTGVVEPRRVDVDNTATNLTNCNYFTSSEGGLANARGKSISEDGRVIVFSVAGGCGGANPPAEEIWARIDATTSIDVSASRCDRVDCNGPADPTFQGAAKDGSRVFFTTTQQLVNGDIDQTTDIYACDIPSGSPAPVDRANPCASFRQVSAADTGAAEVENVLTTSEDGSTVYFVAKGVLAANEDALKEKAVAGDHNLYLWRTDAAHPDGQAAFIGRLDSNDVSGLVNGSAIQPQTTPDGRYLVFTTANQLLSTDTDSSRDVYRYAADSEQLTRASTNGFGVAGNGDGFDVSISRATPHNSHPSVSDDGQKIVFTTAEALSPADGNGEPDLYLWTPGNVSLISTGSVGGGVFVAEGINAVIDGSGQDIYFQTRAALSPADSDDLVDVYDARTGGGFSFAPEPVCSGETCQPDSTPAPPKKAPLSAQPGPGNPTLPKPCPKGKVRKHGKCVKKTHNKHHKKSHRKAGRNRGGSK